MSLVVVFLSGHNCFVFQNLICLHHNTQSTKGECSGQSDFISSAFLSQAHLKEQIWLCKCVSRENWLAWRRLSSLTMAASHWRGWESGSRSVHEPWSLSSYNLTLKAGTGVLRELLFFGLHWNSEEGRLGCQQKMVGATVQQMYLPARRGDEQSKTVQLLFQSSFLPILGPGWGGGLFLWANPVRK